MLCVLLVLLYEFRIRASRVNRALACVGFVCVYQEASAVTKKIPLSGGVLWRVSWTVGRALDGGK